MPTLDIAIPPAPDPTQDPAAYLRSIYAVRERSTLVHKMAHANQLNHFDVDLDKFKDTADYVIAIIKVRVALFDSLPLSNCNLSL
jgi:hypothetical protein